MAIDCSELSQVLTDLALSIATKAHVKNLNDVVVEMQTHIPLMTRPILIDAINEATKAPPRDVSDLTKKLAAIKREAKGNKTLEDTIDRLAAHIEAGTLPTAKERKKATSEAIGMLRTIRNDLNKQLAKTEPALRQKFNKQIAELRERIRTGDVFPAVRPEARIMSMELEKLQYERNRLRRAIRVKILNLKPKGIWERVAEPANTVRALMTSFDLSAVFRQGGFTVLSHPIRSAQAFMPMLRAAASPRVAARINSEILNRRNAPLYARGKLFIAPVDGSSPLAGREEAYQTAWAEHIPGVAASERAYITFLNLIRADSFDALVRTIPVHEAGGQQKIENIANFVNTATGRGNLGMLERASVALNTAFFAPRYVSSRFQLLTGHPMWRKGAMLQTSKLIAIEYARYLTGLSIVYMMAKMAGAEIEFWPPYGSDWGKIKIGKYTRIDPLSGISQSMVMLSRIFMLKTKTTTTGEIKPLRGEGIGFGGNDIFDSATRFMRSKFSPIIGMGWDALTGENVVGEKVTVKSILSNALIPLSMKEVYDTLEEQGVPKAAAISMLSIMGMGVQTYGRVKLETEADIGHLIYNMSGEAMMTKEENRFKLKRYRQIASDNELTETQMKRGLKAYMTERFGKPKGLQGIRSRNRAVNSRIKRMR